MISQALAEKIYDFLVDDCGAPPDERDMFIRYVDDVQTRWANGLNQGEFRFRGVFGYGGKFYFDRHGAMTVNGYAEDMTSTRLELRARLHDKLQEIIKDQTSGRCCET